MNAMIGNVNLTSVRMADGQTSSAFVRPGIIQVFKHTGGCQTALFAWGTAVHRAPHLFNQQSTVALAESANSRR